MFEAIPVRTIDRFVREVADGLEPWIVYGARFRHDASSDGGSACIAMWLNLSRGDSFALIDVDVHETNDKWPRKHISGLRRVGYTTHGRTPTVVRRPLRGRVEILAEASRAGLLRSPVEVAALRPRSPRPIPKRGTLPFPNAAFAELQKRNEEWLLEWLAVEHRGPCTFTPDWRAVSWFSVLDDGEEQHLDVGVQLFRRPGRSPATVGEFERLRRAMRDLLGPHGYRYLKVRYVREEPPYEMINFDKAVKSLADGRRERARIDRLVFGTVDPTRR